METSKRVYVAGHRGLLGSAFVRRLEAEGFEDVVTRHRDDLDLRDQAAVEAFFAEVKPQVVVHCAAVVGGILRNRDFGADLIEDNLLIAANVLRAARHHGAETVLYFGSSCMYPKVCDQPMAEAALGSGPMEPTSLPYSTSKHAGVQMCLAYNRQDGGERFVPVIPNTMYGPGDDFDPATCHVLPALMRRFHEAVRDGKPSVTLWGSGNPRREHVYVDDVVDACWHLLGQGAGAVPLPVNVGTGEDHSIRELAEALADVVGFTGELEWDRSKPDGAPRKLLDSSRLRDTGWSSSVGLREGLGRTYEWFRKNEERLA